MGLEIIPSSKTLAERVSYILNSSPLDETLNDGAYTILSGFPSCGHVDTRLTDQLPVIVKGFPPESLVYLEISSQSNEILEELVGKSSEEVEKIYSSKHENVLRKLGNSAIFEPIYENVNRLARQVVGDFTNKKFFDSPVIMDSLDALDSYVENHSKEVLEVYKKAREKRLFPAGVIRTLALNKQEEAIDYFLECVKSSDNVDKDGIARSSKKEESFLALSLPFILEYLFIGFGKETIREKISQQNSDIQEKLKIFLD